MSQSASPLLVGLYWLAVILSIRPCVYCIALVSLALSHHALQEFYKGSADVEHEPEYSLTVLLFVPHLTFYTKS
jgi:hypothetical protein